MHNAKTNVITNIVCNAILISLKIPVSRLHVVLKLVDNRVKSLPFEAVNDHIRDVIGSLFGDPTRPN